MGHGSCSPVLPLILCCLFILSPGCISEIATPAVVRTVAPVAVISTPESPVATLPAAGMALQVTDLPSDYHLRDRTVTAYGGIGQIFRDLGWQQGYLVTFYRLDTDIGDMTSIIQEIDIYPLDSVKDAYSLKKEALLPPDDSRTDYQVPFPRTGDRSIAWREVRSYNNIPVVTYTVIFTKKNVYERISMTGTSTDYEVLKDLAMTAAARIQ